MLFGWTLNAAWQFVTSSASIGTLVGIAGVAVALGVSWVRALPGGRFLPANLRTWAIAVAVVAFTFTGVATKFYGDGLAVKQTEWDEAKEAARIEREALERQVAEKAAALDKVNSAAEAAADAAYEKARNEFLQGGIAGACTLDDDTIRRLQNIK